MQGMLKITLKPPKAEKSAGVAGVTRELMEQRRDLERRNGDREDSRIMLVPLSIFDTLVY